MPPESKKALLESRANKPNKFELRRQQLAEATLATLGEFGYAKTTLRDIAAKSDFSLGTLHYYFVDKDDLICYCVRNYKRHFIDELNSLICNANDLTSLTQNFINYFVQTISLDSESHRLWYDIRSQAMFDEKFRPLVTDINESLYGMIENLTTRVHELTDKSINFSISQAYWALDGMFQHFLLAHLEQGENSDADFNRELTDFFQDLFSRQ